MTNDGRPATHRTRDHLRDLGFTEYEAACLVAVLEQPGATAADIAESSALPRSRVYDVAESLADRGLLEVEEGEPKRYRPIPREEIRTSLESEYDDILDSLGEALAEVEPGDSAGRDGCSVWSFSGRRSSLSRSWELIDDADERVWMLVREGLLSQDCIEVLGAASERNVDLVFATDDSDLRQWLGDTLTDPTFVSVPPALQTNGEDGEIARLLLADGDSVLTITRCQDTPADPAEFVGCMGTGERCGFVIACRGLVHAPAAGDDVSFTFGP